VGKAAEHLVCVDLLMKGYNAFLSDQGLPYDVVIDLGRQLVRVQVKGTAKPKNPMRGLRISDGYFFHARRAGRGRRRVYGDDEFDIYALVALDIYAVAYFARDEVDSQTICLRVPGVTYGPGGRLARHFEDGSLTRAIETATRPRPHIGHLDRVGRAAFG
jgi:hypothetical protein